MPNATQILVVENDKEDSYLLARQLQQAQIDDHTTWVRTGREALDFLARAETPPLAVFLDLRLPGMSGVEVLEKIRRDPRHSSVPVVVMTGTINPSDLKKCRALGVVDILAKPIKLTHFIKTVAHIFPAVSEPDRSA